jgi:hypothetical protein
LTHPFRAAGERMQARSAANDTPRMPQTSAPCGSNSR